MAFMPGELPIQPQYSVAGELLAALAEGDRAMSVCEMTSAARLSDEQAALQLSVARIAGFVRALPGTSASEALYMPTTLGYAICRRTSSRRGQRSGHGVPAF